MIRYRHHLISESQLVGESALVAHVLHRGGVFADENGGESGHEIVVVSQFARVAAQFGFQVLADLAAVHDYRWHRRSDRNDSTESAAFVGSVMVVTREARNLFVGFTGLW